MAERRKDTQTGPDPTIKGILLRLGMNSPGAATMVIVATAETHLSPEQVWETWTKLEQWTRWSKPLHVTARWLEGRTWEVGSRFEQVRNLGAPAGRQVTVETVREVNPGQSVAWWGAKGGSVRTGHLWFFEAMPNGGTRVHSTEVFMGLSVFLFRFLLKGNLKRMFEAAVDGLVKAAEREHSGNPGTPG